MVFIQSNNLMCDLHSSIMNKSVYGRNVLSGFGRYNEAETSSIRLADIIFLISAQDY